MYYETGPMLSNFIVLILSFFVFNNYTLVFNTLRCNEGKKVLYILNLFPFFLHTKNVKAIHNNVAYNIASTQKEELREATLR